VAEGRRRLKRIQLTMTRHLFWHILQTELNAELSSCGRCCTFAVLLARPQNSCISPHTTDRQKSQCSGNGGWCLRCQSSRLLCPEIRTERAASRSRYQVDHTDGLLRI